MRDVRGRDERINRQRRAWDGRANGKWTNTRDAICKAVRRLAHILRIYIYFREDRNVRSSPVSNPRTFYFV